MRKIKIPSGTVSVHLLSQGLSRPLIIFSPSSSIEKRVLSLTTAGLSLDQWRVWLTRNNVPYCVVCETGKDD